jgi:tRNA pseudouridine55 synthase
MNGLLLLNKALGLSSNRAMQEVKRLFGLKKLGHTGSLDPLASGMLPLCLGEATKFAQYLLDAEKEYEVEGCFGVQTSTGDREGTVVAEQVSEVPDPLVLERFILAFKGDSEQVPPMYSALKYQGQPLYRYALQGIDIPRPARNIHISQIKLLSYQYPYFKIRVRCSKGTYMRTLIEDIAKACGQLAHVTKLHRTSTAGFLASEMISMEALLALNEDERRAKILPMDVMVGQFPELSLDANESLRLQQGQVVFRDDLSDQMVYRLYHQEFIGLGAFKSDLGLVAKRMCRSENGV